MDEGNTVAVVQTVEAGSIKGHREVHKEKRFENKSARVRVSGDIKTSEKQIGSVKRSAKLKRPMEEVAAQQKVNSSQLSTHLANREMGSVAGMDKHGTPIAHQSIHAEPAPHH